MAIKLLRIVLALVVAAQALSSLFPLLATAAYRFGLIHPTSGAVSLMVPLWAATRWWQLVVWTAGICLLLAASLCLLIRRRALWLYLAGFATNVGLNLWMQREPVYHQVFGHATARFDYDRLAILVLVGALIWWVEAQPAKRASGPAPPPGPAG